MFLASAGYDAQQSLDAMPQVAKFAQAGLMDLASATNFAADAQGALGLKVKDPLQNITNLTRVTDVLTAANNLANGSVEDFSKALTTGAAVASKIAGKSIEETVAVLATFADQGVKAEEAGTAFGIVMRDLQTKALENATAFKQAGVTVFDTTGDMRNMADIVADLESRLLGLSDAGKKSALMQLGFADKSVKFIQSLIGTSDAIRGYEMALKDAGGTTTKVAESMATDWEKSANRVKGAWTRMAEYMSWPVAGLGRVMEGSANVLDTVTGNSTNANTIIRDSQTSMDANSGRHMQLLAAARDRHRQKNSPNLNLENLLSDPSGEWQRLQQLAPKMPSGGGFGGSLRTGFNFLGNQLTNANALGSQAKSQAMDTNALAGNKLAEMAGAIGKAIGPSVQQGLFMAQRDVERFGRSMGLDDVMRGAKGLGSYLGSELSGHGGKRKSSGRISDVSLAESGSIQAYQQRVRGQQQFEKARPVEEKQLAALKEIVSEIKKPGLKIANIGRP